MPAELKIVEPTFDPPWFHEKKINDVKFCEVFLETHPMICVNGSFFTKDGKVHDEALIKKQIYELLKPYLTHGLDRKINNILDCLRMEAYCPELPIQEDRIHVANGTLFLDGTYTTDMEYCHNRLPVFYSPDAPAPEVWLHFLEELLTPEDILTLQEYMGYCLIPTTRGQAMMLLVGNGGEGKSRIGLVFQALFGTNMKNGSISKIEHSPFARADLEHVLVMLDDDMKMEALKSTHYLKSLITAEMPMDLERKGEQSYQGQIYARFICFANGVIQSLFDHSDGFYRRQLLLSVKPRPSTRIDDPFLSDRMCKEASGIFLWAFEGLQRLLANNYHFTESEQTRENREKSKEDALNVLEFLRSEGYFRLKADYTITSAYFYTIYCKWCADNAYKPLAQKTVSSVLKKYAREFNLEPSNKITNRQGRQVNGFWGIEALISPNSYLN